MTTIPTADQTMTTDELELANRTERRKGGRRAEDRAEGVSALTFGLLSTRHLEAEGAYFRALDEEKEAKAISGRGSRFDGTRITLARITTAGRNGRAEGLAEAISILTGDDVVEVRARAALEIEARERRGLEGVGAARARL